MTKPNLATEIDRLRRVMEAQDATIRDLRGMVESLRPDAERWRQIERYEVAIVGEAGDTPAQAVDRAMDRAMEETS